MHTVRRPTIIKVTVNLKFDSKDLEIVKKIWRGQFANLKIYNEVYEY